MNTIAEYKTHFLYSLLSNELKNIPFHQRVVPLLKTIVSIKHPKISSQEELEFLTGCWERKFDDFFMTTYYSELHHYEEVMFIRSVVELIREYEKNPFDPQQLLSLLFYFITDKV